MTGSLFIDTSVLVFAYDRSEPEKQGYARQTLGQSQSILIWKNGYGLESPQEIPLGQRGLVKNRERAWQASVLATPFVLNHTILWNSAVVCLDSSAWPKYPEAICTRTCTLV